MERQPYVEVCSVVLSGSQFTQVYLETVVKLQELKADRKKQAQERDRKIDKELHTLARPLWIAYKKRQLKEFYRQRWVKNFFRRKIKLSEYRSFWNSSYRKKLRTFSGFLWRSFRVEELRKELDRTYAKVVPFPNTQWGRNAFEEIQLLTTSCVKYPHLVFNIPVALIEFLDKAKLETSNAPQKN